MSIVGILIAACDCVRSGLFVRVGHLFDVLSMITTAYYYRSVFYDYTYVRILSRISYRVQVQRTDIYTTLMVK